MSESQGNTVHHLGALRIADVWPVADDIAFAVNQPSVEDMLVQSIQSQTLKVVGECLNALSRRCLLDLCKAWPRLLSVAGVASRGARRYPRESWQWAEMKEAVELALCYAEQPESLKWQDADAVIRGYALTAAEAAESRLESEIGTADYVRVQGNAAVYRSFAEGRS